MPVMSAQNRHAIMVSNTMRNTFRIGKTVLAFMLMSAMMLAVFGCSGGYDPKKKTGIDSLRVISATGNKDNWNNMWLNNKWDKGEQSVLLRNGTAMKLIDEINKLPDVFGDKNSPYAYKIELVYYDKNSEQQFATKYGYGGFPDNWSTIVSYANDITPDLFRYERLTDSTDIVTIDADYLRENFDFSPDMLPKGVTVEQFIKDAGLTYEKISYRFRMNLCLSEFKYAYYGFASHRIKKDTKASASDTDALKKYASENLDSIDSSEKYSVAGKYKGNKFEILRFDCFEEWKKDKGVTGYRVNPDDDTVDIYYERVSGKEGMKEFDEYFIYVDPSNRFLIITQCTDYDLINKFFNRE